MNDVARRAGVALKTVSRHVNGATNIDPALSTRIAQAIDELGYRRNLAAASIRPGWTTRTVGLIISDLGNPYFSALARSIEAALSTHGYLLTISSSNEDGATFDRLVDRLIEQQVDAIIAVPPRNAGRDWIDDMPALPPVVFVDRPMSSSRADTVLADNEGGAKEAVLALLASGARRIAFLGDSLSIYTMGKRLAGYCAALEVSGLQVDDSLVSGAAHTIEDAVAVVEELLIGRDADAVFAANNRAALGALFAFKLVGRRIRLVGFDDFESSMLSSPPVSVINQDIELMGRSVAAIVLDRINGGSVNEPLVLRTELILRGSETPPKPL